MNSLITDTERVLALLQGLRACNMFKSIPVLPEEDTSEHWLSMEVFAGGLENQSLLIEAASQQSVTSHIDPASSFIKGLVHPEMETEIVKQFLQMVHSYCKHRNMVLALTEHNVDHPVERFSRLFMACLLKLHDLIPLALLIVMQPSDNSPPHFPSALADICKLVYDAKLMLVKSRQESSCTYDEICGPAIDRCLFLIDNIRSPATDVYSILHRHQLSAMESRWKQIAHKALDWHRNKQQSTMSSGTTTRGETGSFKRIYYEKQQSREKKSLEQQTHEV